jgi:hypothetical protein
MSRLATTLRAATSIVLGTVLVAGGFVSTVRAAVPDASDVVLEFDFSSSILSDAKTRTQFAGALDEIATRVDQTAADLTQGDTAVSFVQFATRAIDYPGCIDLQLLNNPDNVTKFSTCLRNVARDYRSGLAPKVIGTDTNYVAAMQQAAKHLPADAARPALILFTDGKHDVTGVPATLVQPARDRLVAAHPSFALLPVGMGLDPKLRPQLEAGLNRLKITKNMPPCVSGATFDWKNVVFNTPDQAGTAVATALQDATCTFTVAPTPAPTPPPTAGAVLAIRATPADGRIDLLWSPPRDPPVPITGYVARCKADDGGDWIQSTQSPPTVFATSIDGLTNGAAYQCEVATLSANGQGPWTPIAETVTPIGRPATPEKPSISALDRGLQLGLGDPDPAAVTEYHVECSSDKGGSWQPVADVPVADASTAPTAQINGLTNGTAYVCRSIAKNAVGDSDASPVSDSVIPCGGLLECNGLLLPVIGILGLVLALGLLAVAFAIWREGRKGYVIAVVDVVHTTNLGHGSRLGIGLIRAPDSRAITGIAADRTANADIKIRLLPGGRFSVRDGAGRHVTTSGEPLIVVIQGHRHELVLHAFATNAASRASGRS